MSNPGEIDIEALVRRVSDARRALDAANCDLGLARRTMRQIALNSRPDLEDAAWNLHALCAFKFCSSVVTACDGMLSFEDPAGEVFAEAPIAAIRALIKVYDENPDLR